MSRARVQQHPIERFITGLVMLTLFATAFMAASLSRAGPVDPEIPSRWRFTLPKGDPAAGEKAFVRMQCYSCHEVTGKTLGNEGGQTGRIGPEFTAAYAKLPAGYLAESIINFDRFISHANFRISYMSPAAFKPTGGGDFPTNSRMANYNEITTVQEMIDIVAFLKSLDRGNPQ